MRGLFTKIFLCFWIAQSLTFVISTTLILQHHFARPDQLVDVLKLTLGNEARAAANAYESGGCDGLARYAAGLHQTVYMADSSAHLLCQHGDSSAYNEALSRMEQARLSSTRVGQEYLWSLQIHSASKRQYFFLLSRPFRSNYGWLGNLRFFAFPQLPVAIVVFGLTTFVLVLLLTRPIARLRAAARDLATGKLKTRVVAKTRAARLFGGDEIQGLVDDFNHMAEQLESQVAAQKMLLRDVSHELRSPLARLSVALELAREEAPPRMADQLQRIERETARLNQLIGDLLRLSSMESSHARLDHSEFSINELLEEMLADAEFEAQQRTCRVELRASCSCTVPGNPELIYRAVENVVRNAIRYTQDGSVVELDLSSEGSAGQQSAVLQVSDRGPGLPESELRNVFQPFYRIDDARQRNTGGFGVGLALTERAVRLHHGEVQAQNRPGGGLTITLRLPCVRVEALRPTPVP
jgi:two-component system, OmpR family, sensor histidine kinase CpxA